AVLLAWEILARSVEKSLIPGPVDSLRALADLVVRGVLVSDMWASLRRVAVGFALASLAGIVLGLGIGLFHPLRVAFAPVLELLRPIPPIAWIPIAITLFGIGNESAYFVIFVGAFFPVLTNTTFGVREVLPVYLDSAKVLGASRW